MNAGGWIMLVLCWGFVLGVAARVLWRTLHVPPEELSAPLEVESELSTADPPTRQSS
ncbi:MAG: hypothetical protein PHR35_01815 [Kiritimatiellae bacterium]|nr:hypothetical protein [Kiritimatiellia bacterium]